MATKRKMASHLYIAAQFNRHAAPTVDTLMLGKFQAARVSKINAQPIISCHVIMQIKQGHRDTGSSVAWPCAHRPSWMIADCDHSHSSKYGACNTGVTTARITSIITHRMLKAVSSSLSCVHTIHKLINPQPGSIGPLQLILHVSHHLPVTLLLFVSRFQQTSVWLLERS